MNRVIAKTSGITPVKRTRRPKISSRLPQHMALRLGEEESRALDILPRRNLEAVGEYIYSRFFLNLSNEVVCCIYPNGNHIELNIKNNSSTPLHVDMCSSIFSVFSKNYRRHDLKKKWYRNVKDITILPGRWMCFYAEALPVPVDDVESYLLKLKKNSGESIYLFAQGPQSVPPHTQKKIHEMFDILSSQHNDLLNRYKKQTEDIVELKQQLKRPLKIAEAIKEIAHPQDLARVINYPLRQHIREALKKIFDEMLEQGLSLETDSRYPFVRVLHGSQQLARVVPKKEYFNITVANHLFSHVEDVYPWYAEISSLLFELCRSEAGFTDFQ